MIKTLTKLDRTSTSGIREMEAMASEFYNSPFSSESVNFMEHVLEHVPRKYERITNSLVLER